MKLPPWWKVKREIWRVRDNVKRRISGTFLDPVRRLYHDYFATNLVSFTKGKRPLTDRVAIILVFQPDGILDSTLLTLEHLQDNRWSIVVVVNHPVIGQDRTALLERCGTLIQRPNIGYDFGAYREGIRYLWAEDHHLDKLIIMNDSTWFPIRRSDTSLQRMEALNSDMAGHIYKIEDIKNRKRDHLESHLLMFGPKFLAHPRFKRFWNKYLMSNNRATTIERGEKGISQLALSLGMHLGSLHNRDSLVKILKSKSDPELLTTLTQIVHHRDEAQEFCDRLITASQRGEPWREEFIAWVHDELSNSLQHLLSVAFVEAAVRDSGMGFLKKDKDKRHHLARLAILDADAAGRIEPLDTVVRAEIEQATKNWKPPFDWRARPADN